ncbi:MAG: diguanylate cyclase, partial [Deltaproteobacteria bacterium]|nr:diguanylate cyclase [Deltaproteobacteria bacterium]
FDLLLSEKIKTALTLANTPILKNALETSNSFYTNLSDEKRKDSIKLLNEQWKSTKDPADKFIQKLTENKASHFLKNQQIVLKGEYGEIFLTNKFGALVASTSKLSTFAHGHKYWWLGSYNNGEGAGFFDDRGYDDSVDGYVLGLVVPIRKGKEVIGILKCNLNILGNISELIVGAGDTLIGKLKLIRSGGMVVFEEGFEPLSTQIHDDIYRKIKNKNNDLFILNDSGEKYLVGFSEVNLTKEKSEYGFGGTFESIDHKKGNTGESWYVLCSRQMSVVQAPIIESIKWGALISTAIILILGLVSYLFGRKIAKPLLILDKATKKIGKGDFEYRIELKQKDEFGNLAHSFNKMADRLHHTTTSIELLEKEINDRKQAEKALQKSEEKFRRISENTPAVVYQFKMTPDGAFTFPYINNAVKSIMGVTAEDVMRDSSNLLGMIHPEDQKMFIEGVLKSGKTLETYHEIFRCLKDGKILWLECRTTSNPMTDGTILWDGFFVDITAQKQAKKELELLNLRLEYEVSHDPLTGALSRRAILDSLSKELIRAKRRNTKLSIGLCDIDHFKHVNDKHGHQVGDDVLCSFVKATQNVLRPYDIVGRYGGEEFLLVVPDFKESSEKGIYERVRATIAEHKMVTRSGDVSITISIGIASSSGDETADEILAKADAALYRAKENGRNQLAQNI